MLTIRVCESSARPSQCPIAPFTISNIDVGQVAKGHLALRGNGENVLAGLMDCRVHICEAAHQLIASIDEHDGCLDDPGNIRVLPSGKTTVSASCPY